MYTYIYTYICANWSVTPTCHLYNCCARCNRAHTAHLLRMLTNTHTHTHTHTHNIDPNTHKRGVDQQCWRAYMHTDSACENYNSFYTKIIIPFKQRSLLQKRPGLHIWFAPNMRSHPFVATQHANKHSYSVSITFRNPHVGRLPNVSSEC